MSRVMESELTTLRNNVATEFNESLKVVSEKGDMKQILRFTDLLMRIDKKEDAIAQYTKYYSGIIINEASTLTDKLGKFDIAALQSSSIFATIIQGFIDFSLKLVSRQEKIKAVEVFTQPTYYQIMQSLYKQINESLLTLVNAFQNTRRIGVLQTQKSNKDYPDQEVLIVLDEIAMINNAIVFYKSYFEELFNKIMVKEEKKENDGLKNLNTKMDGLLNSYVMLEENYLSATLSKNIKKNIKIGEFNEALDLVFYMLQQSAKRVLLTKSFCTVCAVINLHVITIKTTLLDMTKTVVKDNTSFTNVLSKVC